MEQSSCEPIARQLLFGNEQHFVGKRRCQCDPVDVACVVDDQHATAQWQPVEPFDVERNAGQPKRQSCRPVRRPPAPIRPWQRQ